MKYILFILILFSFLSCKKNAKHSDISVIDHSIKSKELLSFENRLIDTMIFNEATIIPLETNEENLFRKIDRIAINNGRIYFLDNSIEKVCIFDDQGKYINKIDCIGQGPGEYVSIMDFCLNEKGNEIILLCDIPYKLMRFTTDGKFINETAFSNFHVEISADSDRMFCMLNENKEKHEIGCFDEKMKPLYQGLASRKEINKECYYSGKRLVKSQNLIYSRRFDPCIYHLSKDSIEKKYEFNFGKYQMPEDLQFEMDCNRLSQTAEDNKYIYSITNTVESDKYIFFTTNLGICIYEKETNTLKGYKILINHSLNSGSNIYFPNEGNGETIITYIEPEVLNYYSEEDIKNNRIVSDLVKKVKPDDNPILIVYPFK